MATETDQLTSFRWMDNLSCRYLDPEVYNRDISAECVTSATEGIKSKVLGTDWDEWMVLALQGQNGTHQGGDLAHARVSLPTPTCQRCPLKTRRRQKRTHELFANWSNNQITRSALIANETVCPLPSRIIPTHMDCQIHAGPRGICEL